MITKGNRGGFVTMILIIVVALIVLGFFGYNLRAIMSSGTVHDNLSYAWNTFIVAPFTWLADKLQSLLPAK